MDDFDINDLSPAEQKDYKAMNDIERRLYHGEKGSFKFKGLTFDIESQGKGYYGRGLAWWNADENLEVALRFEGYSWFVDVHVYGKRAVKEQWFDTLEEAWAHAMKSDGFKTFALACAKLAQAS